MKPRFLVFLISLIFSVSLSSCGGSQHQGVEISGRNSLNPLATNQIEENLIECMAGIFVLYDWPELRLDQAFENAGLDRQAFDQNKEIVGRHFRNVLAAAFALAKDRGQTPDMLRRQDQRYARYKDVPLPVMDNIVDTIDPSFQRKYNQYRQAQDFMRDDDIILEIINCFERLSNIVENERSKSNYSGSTGEWIWIYYHEYFKAFGI